METILLSCIGRKQVPDYIYKDNPGAKIMFIVRNPITRTESHHRYGYHHLYNSIFDGNINEIIHFALNRHEGNLVLLYDKAVAAEKENNQVKKTQQIKELIKLYHKGFHSKTNKQYQKAASIISHSLYFPAVFYWREKFDKNVLVIPVERLSPEKLSTSEKLKFLKTRISVSLLDTLSSQAITKPNRLNSEVLKIQFLTIYQ
jgi:hypothetical protein